MALTLFKTPALRVTRHESAARGETGVPTARLCNVEVHEPVGELRPLLHGEWRQDVT